MLRGLGRVLISHSKGYRRARGREEVPVGLGCWGRFASCGRLGASSGQTGAAAYRWVAERRESDVGQEARR